MKLVLWTLFSLFSINTMACNINPGLYYCGKANFSKEEIISSKLTKVIDIQLTDSSMIVEDKMKEQKTIYPYSDELLITSVDAQTDKVIKSKSTCHESEAELIETNSIQDKLESAKKMDIIQVESDHLKIESIKESIKAGKIKEVLNCYYVAPARYLYDIARGLKVLKD
ncbi:hypothetical protein HBN50_12055 [Halobacteriovorax sp. GB3]|uniref:hypothetical protein n=1 Tax=Halobacteriovorax sp. GB3 TaxID=2719615 RepID=UPI002361E2DE|nr:hypothetical protein [Halobacteriovorax sp. GB3]MDD0853835.1 hypothetical protein [Halobacteriovorax sp. GB3]